MAVDFIIGGIGEGKTALQTFFVHAKIDDGYMIYSNYNLYNIEYFDLDKINDFQNIDTQYNFIVLDEAWISGLDSRKSQSLLNVSLSHKFLQSRKLGKKLTDKPIKTDMMITAQDFYQVDTRIRNICRYIYKPKIILRDNNDKPLILMVDRYDFQKRTFDKVSFPVPLQFNFNHGYFDICESYDTFETIDSLSNSYEDRYNHIVEKYVNIPRSFEIKGSVLAGILRYKENISNADAVMLARIIQSSKDDDT
jgi:hypothetical protein